MQHLSYDLRDESEALYQIMADIPDAEFTTPTGFKNWTFNDILEHLHIWNVAAYESFADEAAFDVVSYAAHIAAQMGANIIKIKPPTSHVSKQDVLDIYSKNNVKLDNLSDRIAHCIQSSFNGKRIVIFSGGPAKGKEEILKEISEIAKGGGFGSIVGRNSFQRPFDEGVSLMIEIMDIYKSA